MQIVLRGEVPSHIVSMLSPRPMTKVESLSQLAKTVTTLAARVMVLCEDGVDETWQLNKVKGMRAAVIYSQTGARLCVEHNDLKAMIVPWGVVGPSLILSMAAKFEQAQFDTLSGPRHRIRVDMLDAMPCQ